MSEIYKLYYRLRYLRTAQGLLIDLGVKVKPNDINSEGHVVGGIYRATGLRAFFRTEPRNENVGKMGLNYRLHRSLPRRWPI